MEFVYVAQPRRVVFGADSLTRVPGETELLGAKRAFLVSSPGRAPVVRRLADILADGCCGSFTRAEPHVPEATAEEARAAARNAGADCVVAIGGGSALDLGKYVGLEDEWPIITIPTTYSGAEITPGYGINRDGRKVAAIDMRALPKTVVYDPLLTLDLPPMLSATTGMNAMAHAVESYYGERKNPVAALTAESTIRRMSRSLPVVVRDPGNVEARADALCGAFLGICSTNAAGISIHHRLSQAIGGAFNIDHGAANAVLLPQVIRFCTPAVPDAMAQVAAALGARTAAGGLYDLTVRIGAPTNLAALGMNADNLEKAVEICLPRITHSPRPVDAGALYGILENALHGRHPEEAV
jgi:maleylacetate reductase